MKTHLIKIVLEMLDNPKIQKNLWEHTNNRPSMLETNWAHIPNDVREERMRQATAEAAQFVSTNLSHVEGGFDAFHVLDQSLAAVSIEGLYLEFGVFAGGTINHIARQIRQTIHGFDAFEGLPEKWGAVPAGKFSRKGLPPKVLDNVELHVGWFDQTLPAFLKKHSDQVAFLHIDSDLYSSAKLVLWQLAERIVPGTVIVFDEYFNYPDWREHEYKAFQEFVSEFGIAYDYLTYSARGYSVAVKVKASGG
ncbi:MAG: class I SAM-dependent methyltransferase [Arenicellales bacterium]|nr:class I SAM-dependent methyltransferase [Arenicellales bacterium]